MCDPDYPPFASASCLRSGRMRRAAEHRTPRLLKRTSIVKSACQYLSKYLAALGIGNRHLSAKGLLLAFWRRLARTHIFNRAVDRGGKAAIACIMSACAHGRRGRCQTTRPNMLAQTGCLRPQIPRGKPERADSNLTQSVFLDVPNGPRSCLGILPGNCRGSFSVLCVSSQVHPGNRSTGGSSQLSNYSRRRPPRCWRERTSHRAMSRSRHHTAHWSHQRG